MKRAFVIRMLAITFVATPLVACGKKPDETKATSGPQTADVRTEPKIPEDATHCRIGHDRKVDANGQVGTVPIRWWVREAEAADFAPQRPGYEFEIVKAYPSIPPPLAPPFVIEPKDGFINTVIGNTIAVDYTNESGQTGQKNFTATLNLYKFSAASQKPLWGQGAAFPFPPGVPYSSGTIVMFRRPDVYPCAHSHYTTPPPRTCRRVLIEYFDYADAASVRDLPQASGPGQNIFPADDDRCGGAEETSDGDGHEGPP